MARPDSEIKIYAAPGEPEDGLDWFGMSVGWYDRLTNAINRLEATMGQFKGKWWHYLCSNCGLAFKQDRNAQTDNMSCSCPRCGSLKLELIISKDGSIDVEAS